MYSVFCILYTRSIACACSERRAAGRTARWSERATYLVAASMLVNVKWGSRRFEGMELDPTRKPLDFKRQLAEISGVDTPRQQLMVKGALVQDDDSWASHPVKDGSTLLLVAATRPSHSGGISGTVAGARGCCTQCSDAARSAADSLWWLLSNIVPLLFSFFWTMFDKSAGAAGNRIAVQRRVQQQRSAPPPRLVRAHHAHFTVQYLRRADLTLWPLHRRLEQRLGTAAVVMGAAKTAEVARTARLPRLHPAAPILLGARSDLVLPHERKQRFAFHSLSTAQACTHGSSACGGSAHYRQQISLLLFFILSCNLHSQRCVCLELAVPLMP